MCRHDVPFRKTLIEEIQASVLDLVLAPGGEAWATEAHNLAEQSADSEIRRIVMSGPGHLSRSRDMFTARNPLAFSLNEE